MTAVWSGRSDENARRAREFFFGVQNSRKARDGGLAGLLDPELMAEKKSAEKQLLEAVEKSPELRDSAAAWKNVAEAQKVRAANIHRYTVLERARASTARSSISRDPCPGRRGESQAGKGPPSGIHRGQAPVAGTRAFSTEPIYKDFETLKLTDSLTWLASQLRNEPQFVKQIFAGKSPQERAYELVQGTKLEGVDLRKKLYEEGPTAVAASTDPMIALARLVDPEARAVRKIMETKVEEVERQAYAQIAKAKYTVGGKDVYPDATFTLRLAFGTVKGYEEAGKQIPFETKMSGLYERSANITTALPSTCRPAGSSERTRSTSTRRSTSSARPTSSAAIREAPSSIGMRKSSA